MSMPMNQQPSFPHQRASIDPAQEFNNHLICLQQDLSSYKQGDYQLLAKIQDTVARIRKAYDQLNNSQKNDPVTLQVMSNLETPVHVNNPNSSFLQPNGTASSTKEIDGICAHLTETHGGQETLSRITTDMSSWMSKHFPSNPA